MITRKALYDPETRVLRGHGLLDNPEVSTTLWRVVPDDYDTMPGTVKLNAAGDGDEPYTPEDKPIFDIEFDGLSKILRATLNVLGLTREDVKGEYDKL